MRTKTSLIILLILSLNLLKAKGQTPQFNDINTIEVLSKSDSLIEFKAKDGTTFTMERLGKEGVLLISGKVTQLKDQSRSILEFTKISNDMKVEYSVELPGLKRNYKILYAARDKEYIYYLLAPPKVRNLGYMAQNKNFVPGGYLIKEYDVLRFNYVKKSYEVFSGRLGKKLCVSNFWAAGGYAYFGGRNIKTKGRVCWELSFFSACFATPLIIGVGNDIYRNPLFVSASFDEKESKTFKWSGSRSRKVLISEVSIPDSTSMTTVVVLDKRHGRYRNYIMNTNGLNFGQASLLDFPKGMQAHYVKAHLINGEVKYLTGLYGKGGMSETQGIFYAKLSGNIVTDFRQIPYSMLASIMEILPEADRGRNMSRLRTELAAYAHNIVEREQDNLLFVEFAYPTYRWVEGTVYNYGSFQTRRYKVFSGYARTKLLAISFDKDGNLKWDRSFDISNLPKQMRLTEQIRMTHKDAKGYHFTYPDSLGIDGEMMNFLAFSFDGQFFSEKRTFSCKLSALDKIDVKLIQKDESIEYWYDNNYLSIGKRVFEDKDHSKKQNVHYFIRKIPVN